MGCTRRRNVWLRSKLLQFQSMPVVDCLLTCFHRLAAFGFVVGLLFLHVFGACYAIKDSAKCAMPRSIQTANSYVYVCKVMLKKLAKAGKRCESCLDSPLLHPRHAAIEAECPALNGSWRSKSSACRFSVRIHKSETTHTLAHSAMHSACMAPC